MHILLVSPAISPTMGGGERYVAALAVELLNAGHRVTVFSSCAQHERDFWEGTRDDTPAPEVDARVHLQTASIRPARGGRSGLFAWRRLMVLLDALPGSHTALLQRMACAVPNIAADVPINPPEPVDSVHGFNLSWEATLLRAAAYATANDCPFVITPFAHVGRGGPSRNLRMAHQRRLLRSAAQVQALSEVERSGMLEWGISANRIAVVGSGYTPAPEGFRAVPLIERFQIAPPYALFVGRHAADKGALDAVRAVLYLNRQGYAVSLVLAGASTPEFDNLFRRLSLEDRAVIHPVGRISEIVKHALLAQAAALVLPSRSDAFGIVLLEAWSHATPVIAAKAGGIPGVVDDGRDGLLVPYGDVHALALALRQLITQPSLARQLGESGRIKTTARYTWPAVARRVLELYAAAHARYAAPL